MSECRFSVVVPTIGRHTLRRTLDSIAAQEMVEGDEVMIVADTLDGPQPDTERLVNEYGYQYVEHAGEAHCYGMPQRNHAQTLIRPGNFYVGTDDTDFFLPDAFAQMRELMAPRPDVPHIFGFIAVWGVVYGASIREGQIGGHNFIPPVRPGLIGEWGMRYQGDLDWIVSTMDKYPAGTQPVRHSLIITDARGGYDGRVLQ